MKFTPGDLVKLKNNNISPYSPGVMLTIIYQENIDTFEVREEFISYGTYAIVIRNPDDEDNEMYGEYQILIDDKFYYCPEDWLEIAHKE
jgi:hypothetical protein